jgi:UDP-N-acetyl-2-amino-2-deoxyglucuronate dehydrogenase
VNKRIGLAVVGVGMAAKPHALALKDLEDLIDVRGV